MPVEAIISASRTLARESDRLRFAPPVRHVYNPLRYAREPQERYLARYARGRKEVLFLGMNPGPWGMAQTGVPFGEVAAVREWLGIDGRVEDPGEHHARVPIRGFSCTRSEVSGRRFWGLMRERYSEAREFARHCFVANYCPLLFLDEAGRNITPDRIARQDQAALFAACDRLLEVVLETLQPRLLVGVGRFAEQRLRALRPAGNARVVAIPHPSPANPAANRGWSASVTAILEGEEAW